MLLKLAKSPLQKFIYFERHESLHPLSMPKQETFEPMTVGNMRSLGVRDVDYPFMQQVLNVPQ